MRTPLWINVKPYVYTQELSSEGSNSSSENGSPAVFPKTPGVLRCSQEECDKRVAVYEGVSNGMVLCAGCSEELRGSVREMVLGGGEK